MKKLSWPSPWVLMLLLICVSTLSVIVALIGADRIGESIIDQQARAAASAEARYLQTLASEEGLASLIATINRRERIHGGAGFRYALTDSDGRPIAGAQRLDSGGNGAGWRIVATRVRGHEQVWHVLVGKLPMGQSLYVAQDTERRAAFRQAIIRTSAVALLFVFLSSTVAGLILSLYLLSRARNIGETAEKIAGGNLSARAEVSQHGDVFDRLAISLNTMLTRIEELMTGMRTITDSMAHDMRKPMSYVLYDIDKALRSEAGEDERKDALLAAKEHAENALATFSALLDVARAESGVSAETMTDADITKTLTDAADLFEPLFEDAEQTFVLSLPREPLRMRVHELLLRQSVGNLLQNASAYAGAGATVTLSAEAVSGGVNIVIADNGPGIPESDRGRVKERFVRLDPARSSPGSGLGLAIAAACAKLHRGALELEDNRPGLRAVLKLRTSNARR
ncbi:MAG: HAMP domain-containing histidine kinase [Proteobacteria bacterium]|nr:HAMP domain-containing histidine kinase [Pseudomonadota bacterium]